MDGGFSMNTTTLHVLIADDEAFVRQGLKYIIDWGEFGFLICGEAENGKEALDKMESAHPDLVLLDIRMPLVSGTELIAKARQNGYTGEFIILSGYSDFEYAQIALQYGVSYYLTKPIQEDKLKEAVLSVKEKILARMNQETSIHQYIKQAKSSILYELFRSATLDETIPYEEVGLNAPIYQVVIYENYTPFYNSYSFADIFSGSNNDKESFEHVSLNNREIILLKGFRSLEHFNNCLTYLKSGTQKGSPLDAIFLAYGRTVRRLSDIHDSYVECLQLMERRFFCDENQHVLSYKDLPDTLSDKPFATAANSEKYGTALIQFLKSFNRRMISQTLTDMKNSMLICPDDSQSLKHFLTDIFLQVKQSITLSYSYAKIPLPPTALLIKKVQNAYYLYEIFRYFTELFEICMNAIGNNSSDSVFDDILYYINNNYADCLKLETIAPLFGYNSSYLGKLFTQRTGKPFNSYLDEIRIKHAMEYLLSSDRKIYEVASLTGYKNVNYFHQKFKRIAGCSPAEYRKQYGESDL